MNFPYITLTFFLISVTQVYAGLTENRVYPRLVKAENLIAESKPDKARELLEEVINIDETNQKALTMLVVLCSDKKDYTCVEKYSKEIKDQAISNYYQAYIRYQRKDYTQTLSLLDNALHVGTLSQQQQFEAILMGLRSAIHLGDHDKTKKYLDLISPYWKRKEKLESFPYITTLLIDNKLYDLGRSQVAFAQEHHIPLKDKALLDWSYKFQTAKRYEDALALADLVDDPKKRYEKQVLIYTQMKENRKAAERMAALYALEHTEENRKRLLYLYEEAGMSSEKEKLYREELQQTCKAEDLRNLLALHKADPERDRILEQYAPFACLDTTERYNLILELMKKEQDNNKILSYLDMMASLKGLTSSQMKTLSYWYAKVGRYTEAVDLMEKVYDANATQENKRQLQYLYAKAGNEAKLEQIYRDTLQNGCDRESLIYILTKHMDPETLKEYYPFRCLGEDERFNYSLDLVSMYKDQKRYKEARKILNDLSKNKHLTARQYSALSMEYASFGQKTRSRKLALEAYEKNPKDLHAIKQLAYSYERDNQPLLAIKYYQKALALQPHNAEFLLALGSLYAKVDKPEKALYYWDRYQKTHRTEKLSLLSAEQAMLIPDVRRAEQYLKRVSSLPSKEMKYRYYILLSEIADAHHDEGKKHLYYKQAMAYNPYRDEKYYADLGYMYYQEEDFDDAKQAFEKALTYKQDLKYNDQLGYTYEKLGEHDKAIETFKKSIDMINAMPHPDLVHRYKLKQEIDNSKSFSGYLAYTSRLDDYARVPISTAIPQSSYNGFSMLELSYKPEIFKSHLFFYLRGLSAVENRSLALEEQTWQPSIGIRYKPFEDQLLTFSVERLFKGGDRSREDTMIRAETAFFDDYHFHPVDTEYWYKNLYLDSAYYIEDDIYSLYANYEHGYVTKWGEKQAIMPYISTSASLHNDNYNHDQIKNIDIGVGVSLFLWMNERDYRPHQFVGRFSIEGRRSLYHTLDDDKTIRMKLELFF